MKCLFADCTFAPIICLFLLVAISCDSEKGDKANLGPIDNLGTTELIDSSNLSNEEAALILTDLVWSIKANLASNNRRHLSDQDIALSGK
ncbi:hypothetical protein LZD49_13280 [Dyadobacter sp. CY261]|uniref:hypothetical protein n=1 Tax=Dyadobacter sp. CY261 TaxID=2907203 RepID=UPI001F19DCB0|nr:hypothetical protein [Dyadobacter sp. CY261]MCF0071448.1 hypothetical protein [Dyadobacter sp. CY261]